MQAQSSRGEKPCAPRHGALIVNLDNKIKKSQLIIDHGGCVWAHHVLAAYVRLEHDVLPHGQTELRGLALQCEAKTTDIVGERLLLQ